MKKLTIKSEGNVWTTEVRDEHGTILDNLTRIEFDADWNSNNGLVDVKLTFAQVELDIVIEKVGRVVFEEETTP